MTEGMPEPTQGRALRRRRLRILSWIASAVAFVVGPVVGMNFHAQIGAAIWLLSAVLALLPFWSHRHP